MKILIVGDVIQGRPILSPVLREQGFLPTTARNRGELGAELSDGTCDAIVLDWEIAGDLADETLQQARDVDRPVVVLTNDQRKVLPLRRAGAASCLLKPFPTHALEEALQTATARLALPPAAASESVTSRNPVMNRLLQLAWRAAETDATVLLLGESGTGKTALAAEIHHRSLRRDRPFVTVHCPCLHPQLLESQLFGHVKGAFTGAVSDNIGRAAAADGGTLFLDEVGDLPLELQPKLLRLLQDREFEPVGDHATRRIDIRVIAATHRDLAAEVAAGRFREDLYYRLNVVALRVVPLRRRPEDILPFALSFLRDVAPERERPLVGFTPAAQTMLQAHPWPGNLRELRNTIERAAILGRGRVVDRNDLLLDTGGSRPPVPLVGEMVSLAELEQAHIREVLSRVGNFRQAARILGIDKSTLYRKVRGLPQPPASVLTVCA